MLTFAKSAMNYLLPTEWTTTFIPLQDKCPVSSFESIEAMFLKDTGESLSDYFSEFNPTPIGAASLAQVHLATVKETGEKVAVKVQHPALAEWINLDLALTRFTFSTLKKFFPEYDLEWLSSEMEYSLPQELDFKLEGKNAMRAKEYFSHKPELPLVIPEVLWAKERILVMENMSGCRPDDLAYLDANGIDRDEVSAALARIFNEMIFGKDAPLHCDPHGGNCKSKPSPYSLLNILILISHTQWPSAKTPPEKTPTSTSSSTTTVSIATLTFHSAAPTPNSGSPLLMPTNHACANTPKKSPTSPMPSSPSSHPPSPAAIIGSSPNPSQSSAPRKKRKISMMPWVKGCCSSWLSF